MRSSDRSPVKTLPTSSPCRRCAGADRPVTVVAVAYVVVGKEDWLVWGSRVVADEPGFCEVRGSGIVAPRAG